MQDEPAERQALGHLDPRRRERQARQRGEDALGREPPQLRLGRHETCLERDERVPAVRLQDDEGPTRREHAYRLRRRLPPVGHVVEEVAHEDTREGAVAEGQRERVGRDQAGRGDDERREAELVDVAIDPDCRAPPHEPGEVRPLAAADLEAGKAELGERRAEECVLHWCEGRVLGRPAVVRGVGSDEVPVLGVLEIGHGW